jgi:hypothetical protein
MDGAAENGDPRLSSEEAPLPLRLPSDPGPYRDPRVRRRPGPGHTGKWVVPSRRPTGTPRCLTPSRVVHLTTQQLLTQYLSLYFQNSAPDSVYEHDVGRFVSVFPPSISPRLPKRSLFQVHFKAHCIDNHSLTAQVWTKNCCFCDLACLNPTNP